MENAIHGGLFFWDLNPQISQGVSAGLHNALSTLGISIAGVVYFIKTHISMSFQSATPPPNTFLFIKMSFMEKWRHKSHMWNKERVCCDVYHSIKKTALVHGLPHAFWHALSRSWEGQGPLVTASIPRQPISWKMSVFTTWLWIKRNQFLTTRKLA